MTSFKLFMAYPGVLMLDDGALFKAMRVAGSNGAMTCVHAENGPVIDVLVKEALAQGLRAPKYHATTRPSILEGEATHRAIRLAELAGTPLYIVHLSAGEALAAVTEARDRGIPIHAETCPHYLVPHGRGVRPARFRGREVRHDPAAARSQSPDAAVARAQDRRPASGLDRPLPVLLQRAALRDEVLEAAGARTTSARSPTVPRAWRRDCR